MKRLIVAELRRAQARRIVRLTLLLAVVSLAVAGVATFLKTGSITESQYRQRVAAVEAEQVTQRDQVQACLRAHGVATDNGKIPNDVAALCFPNDRLRAHDPRFYMRSLRGAVQGTTGVLVVVGWVLGASLVGAEFASRGMTTLLTWEPRRVRVFTAKSLAAFIVAAATALAVLTGVVVVLLPALLLHAGPHRLGAPTAWSVVGAVARGVAIAALAAGIGHAIATIGRSTAAALGAGFAYIIVLENIVGSVVPRWRRWLLLGNIIVLVSGRSSGDVAGRTVTAAALIVSGVTAALLIGAAGAFSARDVA